ncbi:MAG: outer membrane protein assembly factor BamE [Gallionella sp.]
MRIKLILASLLLASCSGISTPLLSPYKMDIRQGNYVTPEMREKLKIGMTKQQVRYVLGTPMLADTFHGNRWDYPYRLEQRGEIVEKQQLTLYFDGDNLARVEDSGKAVADMPAMAVEQPVVEPPVAKVDPAAEALASVQAWAAAWSAKNARDYLAAYTSDYAPKGMSREKWEKQRVDRIGRPKTIEVVLTEFAVAMPDDAHATVSFKQGYRSDAYRDEVQKTLALVKQDGRWLIADEQLGRAVQADKPVSTGNVEEKVQAAVAQWSEAWAARDVESYLASYADTFKPVGMSRAKWEAQRKERIGKASSIEVKVNDLKVVLHDDSHASATFRQDYRSDAYGDSTRKTLKLEKIGDAWQIVAEQAAK